MGNVQGHVQAFDANTGLDGINFQAPGLSKQVEDVKWLPDSNAIAAGGDDSIVWIWNAATGGLQQTYHGHTGWVISLTCSPDGQRIASGDKSGTVRIWPVTLFEGNQPLQETPVSYHLDTRAYDIQNKSVQALAWSPDNRYLASVGHDVQIFDSYTGKHFYTYTKHTGTGTAVQAVAWSPNGKYIASGGMEATVQV